jgi:hypothetical protein
LKHLFRFLTLGLVLAFSCGFTTQPMNERTAQDKLPQSQHALWAKFYKCPVKLDQKSYLYSIVYSPEVKNMDGKPFTISGFMLPLEATEKFKHFLLSKRTPTCPFCPPGEPNEIVEVFSAKPVAWKDDMVTMTGTLKLVNDGEKGIFFQMNDAAQTK